jgi:hypothetical protein
VRTASEASDFKIDAAARSAQSEKSVKTVGLLRPKNQVKGENSSEPQP